MKENGIIEIDGPLVAEQGPEERAIGRYPVKFSSCKMLDVPSQYTESGREIVWSLEFEYLDQPGNLHRQFLNRKNGKGGAAYLLACGMSPTGNIPEEVRLDVRQFGKFFTDQIGKYFEITLQPNKTGKKNIIGSIRPIDLKDAKKLAVSVHTDEIPF